MTGRKVLCLATVVTIAACDHRIAQTAENPIAEGAETGAAPATCGPTLTERLELTRIAVDYDIRYKRSGYDGFPEDERLAFAVDPSGEARVAWLDEDQRRVHVTPLTTALTRRGADTVVEGTGIGGLVAHEDGFALLVLRDDPGEPLADPAANGTIAKAQVLVRVREGTEVFAAPLTGTASITTATRGPGRDCGVGGDGRLVWNGASYGAYFPVHGCAGDPRAPYYGDKLVMVDDGGRALPGGWDWGCSINRGLRLVAEGDSFTAVCLSDGSPFPGLNLLIDGRQSEWLAAEMTDVGYCAGQFGSLVKVGGGYAVSWLSRGIATDGGGRLQAAKPAPDIALLFLDSSRTPRGAIWIEETRERAEANLHVAPYGPDRLLAIWDRIEDIRCDLHTCFGRYGGTEARILDAGGDPRGPGGPQGRGEDELLPAPPNGPEDIVVFPNGDLGWAFVAEEHRSYDRPFAVRSDGSPDVPLRREITVARFRHCPRD